MFFIDNISEVAFHTRNYIEILQPQKTFHILLFLIKSCMSVLYNLRVFVVVLFTICKSYKGSSFIIRYSENLSEDYMCIKQNYEL